MERKIGEIFEYNGEWYQCVIASGGCMGCSFREPNCCTSKFECFSFKRNDHKSVIFKKLEKVGEPMLINGKRVQLIKALEPNASCYNCCFYHERRCLIPKVQHESNAFYVEIKQDKEDRNKRNLT